MRPAPDKLDPDVVALFLDVDGTLLDIRRHPAEVRADAGLIELLQRCSAALGGALSLVSGRTVAEVDRVFAPTRFSVAGSHGAELRFDGGETAKVPHDPLPADALAPIVALADGHDGLLLEYKLGGISLHYRRAPELESDCRRLVTRLLDELGEAFRLIPGKMVFEIGPKQYNKGAAIRTMVERPPFAGRTPVFIGDDVTDEDGFRAVNEMGGLSIRVGDLAGSEARYRLPDVAAVPPWLERSVLHSGAGKYYGDQQS